MTGETVALRPVAQSDLEPFFQHQADPEAVQMGGYLPRNQEALVAHWAGLLADPSVKACTIVVGTAVAGHVSAWTHDGQRHVGYVVDKEFWGRGVATRALTLFLDIENIRPLWAYVAQDNTGSLRVLEKCGFLQVVRLERDERGVAFVGLRFGEVPATG